MSMPEPSPELSVTSENQQLPSKATVRMKSLLATSGILLVSGALLVGAAVIKPMGSVLVNSTGVGTSTLGPVTFERALLDANLGICPSPCTISFDPLVFNPGTPGVIPNSFSPYQISAVGLTIDGYAGGAGTPNTQPFGSASDAGIGVVLDGAFNSGFDGLTVLSAGTGVTIKGLAIHGFVNGINLQSTGAVISGNFIGTDASGISGTGTSNHGIDVSGTGNSIGGPLPEDRNIIGGTSTPSGVYFQAGSTGNTVSGNYIGVGKDATTALGSTSGVEDFGGSNGIGLSGQGNLISGNSIRGVALLGGSSTVRGNRIGTDAAGTGAFGAAQATGILIGTDFSIVGSGSAGEENIIGGNGVGIDILGSNNDIGGNYIGESLAGAPIPNFQGILVQGNGNRILNGKVSNSTDTGVRVRGAVRSNVILGNSIHDNASLGIDLTDSTGGFVGPTPNDPGDTDTGAGNHLQNFPVINSAVLYPDRINIDLNLDSEAPTGSVNLELFKVDPSDPDGQTGQVFLLNTCLPTPGGVLTNQPLQVSPVPPGVAFGDQIVALATSYADTSCTAAYDGTSEFSVFTAGSALVAPPPGVVYNTTDGGPGSLRQAILDANSGACLSPCTITFNIPFSDPRFDSGTGVFTIEPTTPLPAITANSVSVDGSTQTAFNGDTNFLGPEIFLSGSTSGGDGLTLNGTSDAASFLAIGNFSGRGIYLTGTGTGALLAGNYIGVDAQDSIAQPNGIGVEIANSGSNQLITGNVIRGNSGDGILVQASANTNTISGNDLCQIGNGGNGIHIFSSGNIIGDTTSGGNEIATSGGAGVLVEAGTGNVIQYNTMDNNLGLGIDLAPVGPTPNDAMDPDLGANNLQNSPFLDDISYDFTSGFHYVNGTLNSTPSANFDIDLYQSIGGEGSFHESTTSVTTDVAGNASFSILLCCVSGAPGPFVATATSTTTGDGTSEFSNEIFGQADLSITKSDGLTDAVAGSTLTYTVTATNIGPLNGVAFIGDTFSTSIYSSVTWDCAEAGGAMCDESFAAARSPLPESLNVPKSTATSQRRRSAARPAEKKIEPSVSGQCPSPVTGCIGDINQRVFLPVGGTLTFTINATTLATVRGTVSNTATVVFDSSALQDPIPADNTATDLTDVFAVPIISSFAPASGSVGTMVVISGDGFTGTTSVTFNGTPAGYVIDTDQQITATVPAGATTGPIVVTNPVGSATSGTNFTVIITDLTVSKTGFSPFTPGVNTTFNIQVDNLGPSDADSVVLDDLTPPGLTFVSATAPCSGGFPCSLGTVVSGSQTISVTYSVPSGYASSSISNTATVSTTTPESNTGNNSSTAVITGSPSADMIVIKTGFSPFQPGGFANFNIQVDNGGPSDAQNVMLDDPTPPGLTFVSATAPCSGGFPCSLGTLPSGSQTISVTFSVPSSYSTPTISNTVTVSTTTPESNTGNNSSTAVITGSPVADLSVSKSGFSPFTPGGNTTFNIQVDNGGPSDAQNVVVDDPAPAGLTFVSATGACSGGFPCSLGTMAGPSTQITSVTYSVPASYSSSTISNTVTVSTTTTESNTGNNSATAVITGSASADLSVTKSGPASFAPGTNITFMLQTLNGGPSDAQSVVLDDPTPSGLTFVSATTPCTGGFPCSLGTVASGASSTISVTYSVPSGYTPGTIANTASISSSTSDPSAANNSATATSSAGASSDVSIVKSGPASATPGQTVTYSIVVGNSGPSDAAGVTVSDTPSADLTFVSATGACTSFPCTIGTVTAGGSASTSATYSVSASATGSVSNTASVSSSSPDPNSANNNSTATSSVTATADLSVAKSGPASFTPGQDVIFSIGVANGGPSAAAGVTLSDPTPAGLTFVSATSPCSGGFPCSLGSLASTGSTTIIVTYAVPSSYASTTISNTASVSSSASDPSSGNNSSTATVSASASADLSVVKTGPASFTPGQNLTFTMVVSNAGPSDATSVILSDPSQPELGFASATTPCAGGFPCSLGTVAAGGSSTVSVTYATPAGYTSPTISNTASVSSSTFDPSSANNSSTAVVATATADLSVTKTGPAAFAPGQNITFTIDLTNNGPASAAGVTLSDSTPAGLTFVSATTPCGGGFPCNLGTLASSASTSVSVTYSVPAGYSQGTISNTATVTSSTSDSSTANNSSTAVVSGSVGSDLAVTKTGPSTVSPGTTVSYTITVKNFGPSTAIGVTLFDMTSSGLVFDSASAPCSGGFPCSLGNIASGAVSTITANFLVTQPAGVTSVTNTASVTASSVDSFPSNDSSSVTSPICPASAPEILEPAEGATFPSNPVTVRFTTPLGTKHTELYAVTSSSATPVFLGSSTGDTITADVPLDATAIFVTGFPVSEECGAKSSAPRSLTVTGCPLEAPQRIEPADNANLTSNPVTFRYSTVASAVLYEVFILTSPTATPVSLGTSTTDTLTADVQPGELHWYVEAIGPSESCSRQRSAIGQFSQIACQVATPNRAPQPAIPGETTSTEIYELSWTLDGGTDQTIYEIDESLNRDFTTLVSRQRVTGVTSAQYVHDVALPSGYFYKVRVVVVCQGESFVGPDSVDVRIVVLPPPPAAKPEPDQTQQFGIPDNLEQSIFIAGDDAPARAPGLASQGNTGKPFTVTTSQPWLTANPAVGTVPPQGVVVVVTAVPAGLPVGTNSGTVSVTTPSPSGSTPLSTTPISINLVTPVTPTPKNLLPPPNTLFIPSVSHVDGVKASYQSDVRIANTSGAKVRYQVSFTPSRVDGTNSGKQTIVEIDGGATIAMDDIVKRWYGLGSLGDGTLGSIEIRPLDFAGKTLTSDAFQFATVASSRTYNQTLAGSLSQFVPAVQFGDFVFKGTGPSQATALSMQQIAQSASYRTNLGIVEGAGQSATVQVSIFNNAGTRLDSFFLTMLPAEHVQLGSVLASRNITLDDGRIEVQLMSDTGRVTAFATVIDTRSGDPLLVPGVQLSKLGASRYVVPGLSHISNERNQWRSEMRIFNAGLASQDALLTFIPANDTAGARTATLTIGPGEVKPFDNIVETVFGLTNVVGAVQVTTLSQSALVVTSRTYDSRFGGTVGQFTAAVTPDQAAGVGDRALQVLQLEESSRFRTNLGLAEVSGSGSVELEIIAVVPEARVAPVLRLTLAPNEFRQIGRILSQMGLSDAYNTRLSIKVMSGTGRVTGYGAVIDSITQDPYNVQAQ